MTGLSKNGVILHVLCFGDNADTILALQEFIAMLSLLYEPFSR